MERIRLLSTTLAVSTLLMTNLASADFFDPARQPVGYSAPVALSDTGLISGATL